MNIKKIIAGFAASALAVSALAVSACAVEDGEAYVQFAGGDWLASFYNDGKEYASYNDTVKITGNGSYSVTLHAVASYIDEETGDNATSEGSTDLAFAALSVPNGEILFPGMIMTIDSVEVDGKAVALNGTPYTSSDDGKETRVNLYNEWVSNLPDDARTASGDLSDATPTALDKAIGEWKTLTVNFTVSGIEGGSAPAETEAPAATEAASAGNTAAPATADKNNADTGVEGVAAVAGIAIVAAGAIIVAKKRK
ncbi:MAG: hypothetical protein NC394_09565 [Bacteroides sp.]|nr:hypothetical protein [Bacteroides sp.]